MRADGLVSACFSTADACPWLFLAPGLKRFNPYAVDSTWKGQAWQIGHEYVASRDVNRNRTQRRMKIVAKIPLIFIIGKDKDGSI